MRRMAVTVAAQRQTSSIVRTVGYALTDAQHSWITCQSRAAGCSKSEIVRMLIDRARESGDQSLRKK
jgi:hypothetical protein